MGPDQGLYVDYPLARVWPRRLSQDELSEHKEMFLMTPRRLLAVAVGVLMGTLVFQQAWAVEITVTEGAIGLSRMSPAPLSDVSVTLGGSNFLLSSNFLHDFFMFTNSPNISDDFVPLGSQADFSGTVHLVPEDRLLFEGVLYEASGTLSLFVAPVTLDSLVTQPFALTGSLHGESTSGPETVDLTLSGSGVMTGHFDFPDPFAPFRSVTYDITAVPEPLSLTLVALGMGAMLIVRRSSHSRRQ
jgi:hypothetical protein